MAIICTRSFIFVCRSLLCRFFWLLLLLLLLIVVVMLMMMMILSLLLLLRLLAVEVFYDIKDERSAASLFVQVTWVRVGKKNTN